MLAADGITESHAVCIDARTAVAPLELATLTTRGATLGVKPRCLRTHAAVHLTRRRQAVSDSSEFRVILREQVVSGQRRRRRVTDGAVRYGLKPRCTVDAQPVNR